MDDIVGRVLDSRKYRGLYPPTVERIVRSATHIQEKLREDYVRRELHRIWGAYWDSRAPDFKKLRAHAAGLSAEAFPEYLEDLLRIHASTRERLAMLPSFFETVFADGMPETIIDHGCGFMPLAFFLQQGDAATYTGYDIDSAQDSFLADMLMLAGSSRVTARDGDFLVDEFPEADMVFMLKLLPLLEMRTKRAELLELLNRQRFGRLVVSYPVRSLGGKEKGMAAFYSEHFRNLAAELGWGATEHRFPDELFFIVRR